MPNIEQQSKTKDIRLLKLNKKPGNKRYICSDCGEVLEGDLAIISHGIMGCSIKERS